MIDQPRFAALDDHAVAGGPNRHRELAVAQEKVAAALSELLAIADECKDEQIGGLQRRQTSEEALDVALGIVVADPAVEHLDVLSGRLEFLLQQAGNDLVLVDAPAQGDGAAEHEDTALAGSRCIAHRAAAESPRVGADV